MKGKKLVFAVILSLIVCLLLVPTCAFAEEGNTTDNPEITDDQGGVSDPIDTGSSEDGDYEDGNSEDGNSEDGSSEDGSSEDGNSEDGSSEDGNSEDGSSEDGSSEDGDSEDGNSEDGSSEDGNSEDGSSEDGNSEDGSSEDGNSEDGKVPGSGDSTGSQTNDGGSSFMVKFTYGDKSFKLDNLKGNDQFGLADILKELGIEGNIDDAKGDADDLFATENSEDGWKITTKKAFNTEQTMTVIVDGVEYVLVVVDDITVNDAKALQDAIDAGYAIILGDHITGEFVIPEGKTVTIDLNGKTLTGEGKKGDGYKYKRTIYNKGTLIIKDSVGGGEVTNTGWHNLAVLNTGDLTIESGKFSTSGGTGNAWYVVKNLGTMTINGGTFTKDTKDTGLVVNGYYAKNGGDANDHGIKYTGKDAELTINGGTFENGGYSVKNDYNTKLTITNGTFTGAGNYNVCSEGAVEVSGGTFNSNGSNFLNSKDGGAGTLTVSGGNFTAGNGKSSITLWGKPTTTITGGTFNADKLLKPYGDNMNYGGTATITGGKFNVSGLTSVSEEEWSNLSLSLNTKATPANTEILTNDVPVVKYEVVEGKDQTWTKSTTESVKYVLNADANGIVKVLINGEKVDFDIDEDGKIVISAEVLEKLEAGKYEIEFVFADGSCKTELYVK